MQAKDPGHLGITFLRESPTPLRRRSSSSSSFHRSPGHHKPLVSITLPPRSLCARCRGLGPALASGTPLAGDVLRPEPWIAKPEPPRPSCSPRSIPHAMLMLPGLKP
jgi:hypothetical protein